MSAPNNDLPEIIFDTEKIQALIVSDKRLDNFEISVPDPGEEKEKEEFYIFYSFDIANSTQYKTRYPKDWPFDTRIFFDVVQSSIDDEFADLPARCQIKLWKYAGDEALFYQKVTQVDDCFHAVPISRRVLDKAITEIQRHPNARQLLSVKATVWCARTVHFRPGAERDKFTLDSNEGKSRNLVIRDANNNLDFLGPEVDTGFRIAKFATRGRLLVSADLAYLHWKNQDKLDEIQKQYDLIANPIELMKIVGYEKMKGVWDDRGYPIIWFERDWEHWEDHLGYDDHLDSPFLLGARKENRSGIEKMEKVYSNRSQLEKIDQFVEDLKEYQDLSDDTIEQSSKPQAEIHFAPVCINRDGHVLVAKRAEGKPLLPNTWEFGCGQLETNQKIEDCLARTCRDDFGISMSLEENYKPVPLSHYFFKKGPAGEDSQQRIVPGMVYAVFCPEGEEIKNEKKHSELKWIDPQTVEMDFSSEETVADFYDTIKLAANHFNQKWKDVHVNAVTPVPETQQNGTL